MKVIEQLKQKIESIGGSLDEYDGFFCLDAPSGYVWTGNGSTSFTIRYANRGGQSWLLKAIGEEKEMFDLGLYKVTDEKELAATRYGLDDDTWGAPVNAPEKLEWPK